MSHGLETTTLPMPRDSLNSPAGLQSMSDLRRRRLLVLMLNVVTYLAMMWVAATVLAAGGWSVLDIVMLTALPSARRGPSSASGTAVIGLWLLHGRAKTRWRRSPPTPRR